MSMESSIDPQLIEQTKKQIRELVNEITQLSKSDIAPAEFYSEFLTRIITALAAVGGAIWTLNEGNRLTLQSQVNFAQTNLRDDKDALQQHTRLIQKVIQSKEGALTLPNSSQASGESDGEVGNPTPFLLVMGPLVTDLETVGVVEVFQRPDTPINTQKGYLRFVTQMCDIAVEYIKNKQLRSFSDRQLLWNQLEEFTQLIHTSLDPCQAAYTIANEGRRLIECDRLSVAIQKGRKARIVAISGQDIIDKRSNTVRLLGNLATAVTAVEEPIWYMGDTTDFAPQVEDALQEYVDESHSKMVAVLPLIPEVSEDEISDDPKKRDKPPGPIGALIVELIENSRPGEQLRQRTEVVARHSVKALGNALEHESLFLMPLWRAIGKMSWIVKARTLPKTVLIAIAILIALIAICIVPADFELEATGTLEPVERREVYAEIDGDIEAVMVQHGQTVQQGDKLARLRNIELQVSQVELTGKIDSTRQTIMAKQRTLQEDRNLTVVERNRIMGEILELQKQLISYYTQMKHYEEKLKELDVCAVTNGVITTWDVQRSLTGRPVQRGQILMSIAQPNGPWELKLDIPERRIGQILRAEKEYRKNEELSEKQKAKDAKGTNGSLAQKEPAKDGEKAEQGDETKTLVGTLPVTYILASDPSVELQGKLREIHLIAEIRGESGNTVHLKVNINKEDIKNPNIGANVTAKVKCGTRPIGYVWLHDAIAFFYSKIWFRWF